MGWDESMRRRRWRRSNSNLSRTPARPGPEAAATPAMLSAAAAAAVIPKLRFATRPQLRRPAARTYWPRPLSSSSHVTPAAAGAGELEPPDLTRLANAARISLSPQEVSRRPAFFLWMPTSDTICSHEMLTMICLSSLCARSPGRGLRAQDSAGRGLVGFCYLFSSVCAGG